MAKTKFKQVKTNPDRHAFVTPACVLSFANLHEAKSFQNDPKQPKFFKGDFIFESEAAFNEKDKKGRSAMQAVKNVVIDQWGAEKGKQLWPSVKAQVFRKGEDNTNSDGEAYAGYEGKVYLQAKTGEKYKPRVVLANGETPAEENDIYGGVIVRAQIVAVPYNFAGKESVTLRLIGVQKIRDGERLGGGSMASEFDAMEDAGEDFGGESDDNEDF